MAQDSPLPCLSPDALAALIEQCGLECFVAWAAWPEIELGRDDGMAWTISDIPFPFFNNVFSARLQPQEVSSAIDAVVDRLGCRKVPGFWWIGPGTFPPDLGRHLEAAGFEHVVSAPAMAVDLAAVNEILPPCPAALTIEEVVDSAGLRAWCSVMTPVYQFPDFAAEAWFRMLASLGLGPERPFRHFLARLEGKPVATASLYRGAEAAGISNVATLPGHRRRGIGTALTVAVLREARRTGCRIATLFSSVMGRPVYQRIGLRHYATGDCYLWSPRTGPPPNA
ncbi:MAG: GNAT family N-acetyltransferase [Thermoguttaceae bacterium]